VDRDRWAAAYQLRMAKAALPSLQKVSIDTSVVEVALESVSSAAGVVEVALVPIVPAPVRKAVA
jgi:hypothetical protein